MFGNNSGGNTNSNSFGPFGGIQNFKTQFNQFINGMSSSIQPNNMAAFAEAKIREALQNGTITQEQFNQMANTANQMMSNNPDLFRNG